jgi:hypothetical protein
MAWQGDVADKNNPGKSRRIFIIAVKTLDGKRFNWGVSEKSALTELRYVARGTKIWINPLGKEDTGRQGDDGRPIERWVFEVIAERLERDLVRAPRMVSQGGGGGRGGGGGAGGGGVEDMPPDEDIPF